MRSEFPNSTEREAPATSTSAHYSTNELRVEGGFNLVGTSELVVDGDAWLTQAEIGTLFGIDKSNVSRHVSDILKDGELMAGSCVAQFATQLRGEGGSTRNVQVAHYNSDMVCAVGFRVRSSRGVEFRQWVTKVIRGEVEPPKPTLPQTPGLEAQRRKFADPRPTHALRSGQTAHVTRHRTD